MDTPRASALPCCSSSSNGFDAKTITASSPKLADQGISGIRSFSVISGPAAAGFEKSGYAGASTQPVAASLCVSPGWELAAIRLQGQ